MNFNHTFALPDLMAAVRAVAPGLALAALLSAATLAEAAPRGGTGSGAASGGRSAGKQASTPMTTANSFNQSAARISPGWRNRSDRVLEGLNKPGGAGSMGLRSHAFANDGREGTVQLPKTTPAGVPITYTTNTVRPGSQANTLGSARVITGSNGSAYLSRHYEKDLTRRIR